MPAIDLLEVYEDEKPYDVAANRLRKLCRKYLKRGPRKNWDGVTVHQAKAPE